MSRQKPAVSICCQVLPVWRTVKDKSNESSITSPVERCCTGGSGVGWGGVESKRVGVDKGRQFVGGRGSREVWLQAKLYLYVSEVSGDEIRQTGEPVFFPLLLLLLNKSHVIYNNHPPGNVQRSPVKKNKKQKTLTPASTGSIDRFFFVFFSLREPVRISVQQ